MKTRKGLTGLLAGVTLAGGLMGGLAQKAEASKVLNMDISSQISIGDYDPGHTGNESEIVYTVTNTTPNNDDKFIRSLKNFNIYNPTGSDNGVYKVEIDNHHQATVPWDSNKWIGEIPDSSSVIFDEPNDDFNLGVWGGGDSIKFIVWSDYTNTVNGFATAFDGYGNQFSQDGNVKYTIPVPSNISAVPAPSTLALGAAGLGLLGLGGYEASRRRKI